MILSSRAKLLASAAAPRPPPAPKPVPVEPPPPSTVAPLVELTTTTPVPELLMPTSVAGSVTSVAAITLEESNGVKSFDVFWMDLWEDKLKVVSVPGLPLLDLTC